MGQKAVAELSFTLGQAWMAETGVGERGAGGFAPASLSFFQTTASSSSWQPGLSLGII